MNTFWPLSFTKITDIHLWFINIKVWGLMVAIGMLVGLFVAYQEAKRKNVSLDLIFDLFIWIFVSSMIGGRLMYVLLFWRDYAAMPFEIFQLWDGGMVFYGGIFAAIAAILILLRKKKVSFWKMADIGAPALAIGIFFGRIGCYLIGDHVGSKTNFFLASDYYGELRHEPSLYLSFNGLVLFVVLWALRKRLKKEGQIAWIFILWESVTRFFLDFVRASDLPGRLSDPRFFGLTISQYLALLALAFFIPWGYRKFYP